MVLEVSHICKNDSQYSFNVSHWLAGTPSGGSINDQQWCQRFSENFETFIKAVIPASCSFAGVKLQIIKPERYLAQTYVADAGIGAEAGDELPPQVAGLVKLTTALATRHGRGRKYIPFAPEGRSNAAGQPDATYLGNAAVLGALWATNDTHTLGGATQTVTPVLYNRTTGATITITGSTVRSAWATVRRRSFIGKADVAPL
jgi:hypothetical protein